MFFFTVGYKENLYYSLSLAFFGLFNLSFIGLSYQFLWPDSPEFHQHSINIFLQPFLLFLVLFFWNILNPRRIWKNAKIYFRLLYGFIFLCTLGCLIFDVQTGLIISTIESMAISIIIPIILLYLSLKGDRISILCFISYSFLIFGSLSFTASLLGFFNLRLYMGEALQIGSVIEVILFSLVIAYKINLLKSENENSLKKELRATLKNFVFNKKFQTFVPFDFLKILGKEDLTKLELGDNTESEMAILFSDIRDFTSISENLSPQDNFKFINRYLNRVSPIIRQNSGFIDKFMGDGIMALFPKASDALMASFSILNELESFNKELETEDFKLVKIGIGIHFGKLMLGTIGEKGRMETTVISDAVNLASRLESLTKNYQTPIIVSQEFLDNMPKKQNKRIKVESLGEVKVKGKQKPVSIFKVENGG